MSWCHEGSLFGRTHVSDIIVPIGPQDDGENSEDHLHQSELEGAQLKEEKTPPDFARKENLSSHRLPCQGKLCLSVEFSLQ